jgi:hypothetical protein
MDKHEYGWCARAFLLLATALPTGCASHRLVYQGRVAESNAEVFALKFDVQGSGDDVLWLRLVHGEQDMRSRSIGPEALKEGVTVDVIASTVMHDGRNSMRLVVVANDKKSSTSSTLFDVTFPRLQLAGKGFSPRETVSGIGGGELFFLSAFGPERSYESVTCRWSMSSARAGEKQAPAG